MTRTDLINYIIKKQGFKSYLEIGYGSGENFTAIDCLNKIVVDPNPRTKATFILTSDEFFIENKRTTQTKVGEFIGYSKTFDVIFVDGLHHADQVRKDVSNAWSCLNENGCLVIHDTNPASEDRTHVPCDNSIWNGDVYKVIHQIDGPPKFTLNDDHGVTVIRKTGPLELSNGEIEWEGFDMFREAILHLVSWEEAVKIIDGWHT